MALFFCVCFETPDDCIDGYPCKEFTLTVNAGAGGTVTPANRQSATGGTSLDISATANSGYEFVNWEVRSGEAEIGNRNERSTTVTLSSNATVRANFRQLIYTVTFDANGGSVTPASGTTWTNWRLTTLPVPAQRGYRFDGWFTAETGETAVTTSTAFRDDETVYARWTYVHDWGDWVMTPATCVDKGDSTRVCKLNSEHTETREIAINLNNHDWGDWVVTPATCTDKGDSTRVCKRNGEHTQTREIAIDLNNHDWEDWTVTPATCTDKGDSTRVCKLNSEHTEIKEIASLGHDWGVWEETTPATCTDKGHSIRVCSRGDSTDVRIARLSFIDCGYGSFTDTRDGNSQTYKTVNIGNLTWFAENLNYAGSGGSVGVCYNNADSNCTKYGRLYRWNEAMDNSSILVGASNVNHQGICPVGWRLPNNSDWNNLMTAVGGSQTAGSKLKSQTGWNSYSGISSTDEFGFSALPGGCYCNDAYGNKNFIDAGNFGVWWSATGALNYSGTDIIGSNKGMRYNSDNDRGGWNDRGTRFSVRCLRD